MVQILDGAAVARPIREGLREALQTLENAGVTPGLATVLVGDDPADERYISLKHRTCSEFGIESFDHRLAANAPVERAIETVRSLNTDSDVHGIFVQVPLPAHVESRLRNAVDPPKDVDCFTPTNVGSLVVDEPRFEPPTPLAILRLLEAVPVDLDGADVVVVGRSSFVGKPLLNLLLRRGDATVTSCHSHTHDLGQKTRRGDVVVVGANEPKLVDGSMIRDGAVVIDAGLNRVETDDGYEAVGDVDFESVRPRADVVTPVPGGVGPMTLTMLLSNTIRAASRQEGVPVALP